MPEPLVRAVFGDPKARIVSLRRRSKKRRAEGAGGGGVPSTTASRGGSATCRAATRESIWTSRSVACSVGGVGP